MKKYYVLSLIASIFWGNAYSTVSERIPIVRIVAKERELSLIDRRLTQLYKKYERVAREHGFQFSNDADFIHVKLEKDPEWHRLNRKRSEIIKYFNDNKDKIDINVYDRMQRKINSFFGSFIPYRVPS